MANHTRFMHQCEASLCRIANFIYDRRMSNNPIDDLVANVLRNLPEGMQTLRADLSRNLKATLEAGLHKLDLVTRQEFEVQRQILERAQQQLKVLEDKITELEKQQKK